MGLLNKLFGGAKKQEEEQPNQQQPADSIDLSKVFPRIKGVFNDEHPAPLPGNTGPAITMTQENSLVSTPIAEGIAVFYALDMGHSYQILQHRHLSEDITIEKLHAAALQNMFTEVSETTKVNGDPEHLMMVTNGGNYEATMLLADYMWEQLEPHFNDSVCVAIPARDLLFVSAKNNHIGREALRKAVKFYFEESDETQGLLVRHIYERENGQWKLVETA
jgi:hypothetical protein